MRTPLLSLFAVLLLLALPGAIAGAHPSEAEDGPLEVEVRPAVVAVGQTAVVEAEYEPDDVDEDDEFDDDDFDEFDEDDNGADDGTDDSATDDSGTDDDGTDNDGTDDSGTDDDATDDTAGGAQQSTVTFTVDFGDGSPQETMTVTSEDDEDGEAEAKAAHAYDEAGDFLITVTATPETGSAASTQVVVHVGGGAARLDGDTRLTTATAIAREDFPDDGEATAVLLARDDAFADALASASLALLEDAPVLLTHTDAVPDAVLLEIRRALGPTGTVYLLGGESALHPDVETRLRELGYDVRRIAGHDRIETALAIAQFMLDAGLEVEEVVLTNAANFPDALAGAAFAADEDAPVLLTPSDRLDERVAAFLDDLDRSVEVLIPGGTAAVSDAVAEEVAAMGFEVERVAGKDRYETSAKIAEALFADATVVVVATGQTFPDALAGAAHAGRAGAPILLVAEELPDAVRAYLEAHAQQIATVYVLGGEGAVPAEVMAEIQQIVGVES